MVLDVNRNWEKKMRDDLINPKLFGNEAGEDEDKKRLTDYYWKKKETKYFMMLSES